MCKIDVMAVTEKINKSGIAASELSKKLGKGKNYISASKYAGTMPEEILQMLADMLETEIDNLKLKNTDDYLSKNGGIYHTHKGAKRYSMPNDTERLMNALRKQKNMTDQYVIDEVERCIDGAVSFDGEKEFYINPLCIHVPSWQRKTDTLRAKSIASSFSRTAYDAIKVWWDSETNQLVIADGLHRLYAAVIRIQNGIKTNLKVVLVPSNVTKEDIIDMFVLQGVRRRMTTASDIYRGAICNKYDSYVTFRKIFMEENNVQIADDEEMLGENCKGTVRTTKGLLNMCKKYPEMTRRIHVIISDLGWNATTKGNPYKEAVFTALRDIINNYGEYAVEMMHKKCNGAGWFEENISTFGTKSKVYDTVVNAL